MKAGTLRHKVEIQEASLVKDTTGARPKLWQRRCFAMMACNPERGSERAGGNQTVAEADYKFVARFRDWITPQQHRLIHNGETFDIESVIDIGARGRSLEIRAKKRAA